MTWPAISALAKKNETHPPIHVIAAAFIEKNKPKPIGEAIQSSGLPVHKGKVRKRGNISR